MSWAGCFPASTEEVKLSIVHSSFPPPPPPHLCLFLLCASSSSFFLISVSSLLLLFLLCSSQSIFDSISSSSYCISSFYLSEFIGLLLILYLQRVLTLFCFRPLVRPTVLPPVILMSMSLLPSSSSFSVSFFTSLYYSSAPDHLFLSVCHSVFLFVSLPLSTCSSSLLCLSSILLFPLFCRLWIGSVYKGRAVFSKYMYMTYNTTQHSCI